MTKSRPVTRLLVLACTLIALLLANSERAKAVRDFWETGLRIGVGAWALDQPLHPLGRWLLSRVAFGKTIA